MRSDRPHVIVRLLAIAAAFGLLLAACGDDGGDEGDEEVQGGTDGGDCPTDVRNRRVGVRVQVCMEGIAYTEAAVTVSAGDEVTWTNLDGVDHTVTAGTPEAPRPDVFDSGSIPAGESFKLPFDAIVRSIPLTAAAGPAGDPATGEVAYYCTIHPQMQASVLVE